MYTYHMLGWKSIPPTFSLFYLASFPLISLSFSLSPPPPLQENNQRGKWKSVSSPTLSILSFLFPLHHYAFSYLYPSPPFESQNFCSPSLESSIFQFNIVVYHMTVMWSIFLYTLHLHRYYVESVECRLFLPYNFNGNSSQSKV